MKTAHILVFVILLSSILFVTEGGIFGKLFGKKDQRRTKVDENLMKAKNHAYKVWVSGQKGLSDFSNSAWDKLYEHYEDAWLKYKEAKMKLSEETSKALEEAKEDYESTKSDLKNAQNKLVEYVDSFKDKAEEMTKDDFFTGLENVENVAHEARTKFHQARDSLAQYYDLAYEEAVEDYNSAAQYLNDASERLKNYAKIKGKKSVKKIKTILEQARDKAKEGYAESKNKYTEFKKNLDTFNQEISEYVEGYLNFAKERYSWTSNLLKTIKDDTKAKASENYNKLLSNLQSVEKKTTEGVQDAEQAVKWATDRLAHFATDIFATIKEKYQDLKDEL